MRKGPGSVYYKQNIEKYHPRRRKRKLTEAPKLSRLIVTGRSLLTSVYHLPFVCGKQEHFNVACIFRRTRNMLKRSKGYTEMM